MEEFIFSPEFWLTVVSGKGREGVRAAFRAYTDLQMAGVLLTREARHFEGPITKGLRERRIFFSGDQLYLRRFDVDGWMPGDDSRPYNVYLHNILLADEDEAPHSHPWEWSESLILTGGYIESRTELHGRRSRLDQQHRFDRLPPNCRSGTWNMDAVRHGSEDQVVGFQRSRSRSRRVARPVGRTWNHSGLLRIVMREQFWGWLWWGSVKVSGPHSRTSLRLESKWSAAYWATRPGLTNGCNQECETTHDYG